MLNFGILGSGAIAADFCLALKASDHCRVVNVAGSTPEKAAAFAERCGLPRAAADLAALLADPDVAVVYIATPHTLHETQALVAIAAGKHVLCEKPMTTRAAATARLIDAARSRGVLLMEAFMYRGHPLIAALIEQLRSGAIGRLRHIRADFGFHAERLTGHRLFDPALGGGAILDVGGYPMSFARLFAGVAIGQPYAEPVSIRAIRQFGPTGVDELSTALLHFESGISANLSCAIRHRIGTAAVLYGDSGRIVVPDPWLPGGQQQGLTAHFVIHREGQPEEIVTINTDRPSYAIEAEHLADCLPQLEARWPAMDWQDSLANAQALDAWREAR